MIGKLQQETFVMNQWMGSVAEAKRHRTFSAIARGFGGNSGEISGEIFSVARAVGESLKE